MTIDWAVLDIKKAGPNVKHDSQVVNTIGAVVVVRICCQWSGTCHSDTFHSPPKGAEEQQLTVEECTKDEPQWEMHITRSNVIEWD